MVAIPQSSFLDKVSSSRFLLGHSGLVLTLSNAVRASLPSPHLPAQPPPAGGGCRRLHCLSAEEVTVGLVICGL